MLHDRTRRIYSLQYAGQPRRLLSEQKAAEGKIRTADNVGRITYDLWMQMVLLYGEIYSDSRWGY